MRLDSRILAVFSAVASLLAVYCGASSPQPASVEPAGAASAASAASASSSAAHGASSASAQASAPSAADKSAVAEPAPSGPSPRDVLSRPGVLYTVAFDECEVGKKAAEICSKEGDPKKRAACMAKAREKIDFEGMQFTEEKDGSWWWLTLRRKGNALSTLHKVRFEFGDEKNGAITLKTEGGGPKAPSSVSFEVPSDFRIMTNDPKYGKVVLDAKMIGTGKN